MTQPTITVLLAEDEPSLPGLDSLSGQAEVREARTRSELEAALPVTDILVVTDFRTGMLADVWPNNCPVRWVHATSAGVDALMIDPIRHSDIVVTNARGIFDRGIAEYVLGALLMFTKDTLTNLALMKEHRWQHRETGLLRGSRVVVVGAGSIGREVATLLGALGVRVSGTARHAREDSAFEKVYAQQDLPTLLPDADAVIITAPLTPDTEGLFDADQFLRMKPGATLVNVGRGPIVQTEALLAALRSGRLGGAAMDVFEEEPLPADHPLWDQPNVMISAHMAGDFIGWRTALGQQFADNFQRWQKGEPLVNPVSKEHGYVSNAGGPTPDA
ncbi:D-2-hydroxyacid dehydrogenase [Alcanivorax sediminis]|uniref:D-2-hydroxyacid dehydrogenase n=1 Tax=Alcanivorax sediminis TaxID=2663008 RepID=A0A6N7LWP3_9GAMM|nr:D-2-hydroxyacid dehydrogenase [Alcanivorax sediminis]MQX54879.1 D-2-hydroxyacid dehydrogenase [Alcanivorax sediminis]